MDSLEERNETVERLEAEAARIQEYSALHSLTSVSFLSRFWRLWALVFPVVSTLAGFVDEHKVFSWIVSTTGLSRHSFFKMR
mmetsp:Transcript_15802/g.37671  ORF Transcript_15802/g.37671 Transcript_15802/m.37671 type:complete len:82 (+) Transcript_15802:915-1160(+)